MSEIVIYTISDPISGLVRYVGKTIDFKYRCRKHRTEKNKTYKAQWVKGLISKGLEPVFDIIDSCTETDWKDKEIFYIKLFKSIGANLLNQMPGGEGGPTMLGKKLTLEQAKKISNSKLGKKNIKTGEYNAINKGTRVDRYDMFNNFIESHISIRQAGKSINRSPRRIWMMVNNDTSVKDVAGFIFKKSVNAVN